CPRSSLLQRSCRAPADPDGPSGGSARRAWVRVVPGAQTCVQTPSKEKHDPPAGRVSLTVTRCDRRVVVFRRTVRAREEFRAGIVAGETHKSAGAAGRVALDRGSLASDAVLHRLRAK